MSFTQRDLRIQRQSSDSPLNPIQGTNVYLSIFLPKRLFVLLLDILRSKSCLLIYHKVQNPKDCTSFYFNSSFDDRKRPETAQFLITYPVAYPCYPVYSMRGTTLVYFLIYYTLMSKGLSCDITYHSFFFSFSFWQYFRFILRHYRCCGIMVRIGGLGNEI